jgi:hypothetical protein
MTTPPYDPKWDPSINTFSPDYQGNSVMAEILTWIAKEEQEKALPAIVQLPLEVGAMAVVAATSLAVMGALFIAGGPIAVGGLALGIGLWRAVNGRR